MTKIPRNDWKQRSEGKSGHISYITLISWRLEIKRRCIFFTFDWIIVFWLYVCFLRSVNVAPPTTPETTTRVSVSQLAGRDPKMAAGSSDGSQFRWTLGFVPSRWTLGRDAAEKHWAERTDRQTSGCSLIVLMNCGDQRLLQSKFQLRSCTNNKAFILVRMTGLLFWPFFVIFLTKK